MERPAERPGILGRASGSDRLDDQRPRYIFPTRGCLSKMKREGNQRRQQGIARPPRKSETLRASPSRCRIITLMDRENCQAIQTPRPGDRGCSSLFSLTQGPLKPAATLAELPTRDGPVFAEATADHAKGGLNVVCLEQGG